MPTSILAPSPAVRVAVAAVSISAAPVIVKLLLLGGLGPTAVGLWRVLVAALALLGSAALVWGSVRLPAAARLPAVGAGVMFGLDLWLWHRSIMIVGAGMATILGNTQVFWAAGLARVLHGERVPGRTMAAAALSFAGIVLLAGLGSSSMVMDPKHLTGVGLGLVTGLSYAAYVLGLRHAGNAWGPKDGSRIRAAALNLGWALAAAAMVLGMSAAFEGELMPPQQWHVWGWILMLGLGLNVGAWLVITAAAPLLPAATLALLLLLQPALATIWSAEIFDETLRPLQVVGAVLALAGVLVGSWPRQTDRRFRPPEP